MPLRKVPVAWTTGIGGTGVSVFYSLEATDITVALGTFFTAIRTLFPPSVTWQIPASGDVINIPDGKITGSWSGGTAATVTGSGLANYVAGTGAYVRWQTSTIRDGRRIKGRTFLVPLITSAFDSSGTITDGNVTTLQSAATALAGTGTLTIWGRPRGKGATDGQAGTVVSGLVLDKVTSIRTRRT
jgi:hypothetical protein